jgi:hypothetical protein
MNGAYCIVCGSVRYYVLQHVIVILAPQSSCPLGAALCEETVLMDVMYNSVVYHLGGSTIYTVVIAYYLS